MVVLFAGKVLPESLAAKLAVQLGPFPSAERSGVQRDSWTTGALLGPLWEKGVPAFSLLWLSEPDLSQHKQAPGSPAALAAIKSSDGNLARVLEALEQKGMHGSLSRFDMHNNCVAAGPDFREGLQDDLPSGNIDIAPTVLWLLGVQPRQKLSGRLLTEALVEPPAPAPARQALHFEAEYRAGAFVWRQYLECSTLGGAVYLDQGNGGQTSAK